MQNKFGYFNLVEMLAKPGCAICNLALHDVDRYLDSLLYEYVAEPETNDAFREARGLCGEHGKQLTEYRAGALGVAILYEAALDEVLKIIDETPVETSSNGFARMLGNDGKRAASTLTDKLEPTRPCMACETLIAAENLYTQLLSDTVADERMQAAYQASTGLCLPHFQQTLRQTADTSRLKLLVDVQRSIWASLQAELRLFMSKTNVQAAGNVTREAIGAEGDSWKRAVTQVSGERGVFGARRNHE